MMKYLLFTVSLMAMLSSCRRIKDPVFQQIENVRVGRMSLGSTVVNLDMRYYNPNHFKAKLKNAEGDAWVDSVFLGHFVVDTLVRVPANSEFIVPVKLSIDTKYMLQHSMTAVLNKQVSIRIAGTAKAGRGGFYKSFALNYTGMQDLGKLFGK